MRQATLLNVPASTSVSEAIEQGIALWEGVEMPLHAIAGPLRPPSARLPCRVLAPAHHTPEAVRFVWNDLTPHISTLVRTQV